MEEKRLPVYGPTQKSLVYTKCKMSILKKYGYIYLVQVLSPCKSRMFYEILLL